MVAAHHTHRFVPVDILTASYRVVGKMMVSNTGIIGLLNNPNTSFMEIHDARLARIHMPTKLADHFEVIRLTKTHLLIVSLNRREDIGPQSLARGGYATTKQHQVLVTMQNYEAEGAIEWQGRFDFRVLMAEGTRDFIPLYNAKVTGVLRAYARKFVLCLKSVFKKKKGAFSENLNYETTSFRHSTK